MTTSKTVGLEADIQQYLIDHSIEREDVHGRLVEATLEAQPDWSIMQIPHEQGALLTWLVRLVGAKNAVEVGTFTGYSALCIAQGLPDDGMLICCDVSDEYTNVGRPFWEEAGVAHKIDLRIAPAAETLAALPDDQFLDFAFIDADKEAQLGYYEEILERLRPGGVIVIDNTLLFGSVVDPDRDEPQVVAVQKQNAFIAADDRVETVMVNVADGLGLIRKL